MTQNCNTQQEQQHQQSSHAEKSKKQIKMPNPKSNPTLKKTKLVPKTKQTQFVFNYFTLT
jgi:hypothetical protein